MNTNLAAPECSVKNYRIKSSDQKNMIYIKKYGSDNPQTHILFAHGLGGYHQCYEDFILNLIGKDESIAVTTFDYIGHGLSSGTRSHVDTIQTHIDDFTLCFEEFKKTGKKHILIAHSLSALIISYLLVERKNNWSEAFDKIILSNPLLEVKASDIANVILIPQVEILNRIRPNIRLPIEFYGDKVCSNPESSFKYDADPLVNRFVTVRFYTEIRKIIHEVINGSYYIHEQVLVLLSRNNNFIDLNKAELFTRCLTNKANKLVKFSGASHELFNGRNQGKIVESIHQWINQ